MDRLTELYNLAEANGVDVISFELPQIQSVSIMEVDGSCSIGIDPFALDTYSDEAVHLAHELGHCMTGSFYNRYAACDIVEKHERRAEKWAIKKLIPKDELDYAVEHGIVEPWDLAEYFNVTVPFIEKAVAYYKSYSR